MSDPDPEQTILVLHGTDFDPYPVLQRLIQADGPISDEPVEVPWHIDNKYYTSDVTFRVLEVGYDDDVHAKDVPIVIYLFGKSPRIVPPTLIKLLITEPRDIALAIRVSHDLSNSHDESDLNDVLPESSWSDIEEMFEEVGMEVVDESAPLDDDDDRPMTPLETVRQTLMTHMWPKMVRKALRIRENPSLPTDSMLEDPISITPPTRSQLDDLSSSFPVAFDPAIAGPSRLPSGGLGPSRFDDERARDTAFPDMEELRRQVAMAEFGQDGLISGGRLASLDRLEDELDFGPDSEEYAKLDEWLQVGEDDFDDEFGDLGMVLPHEDETNGEGDRLRGVSSHEQTNPTSEDVPREDDHVPMDTGQHGFEDDFDDFSAFQSGQGDLQSVDPTPLLLHLQNVRAELAGVTNEDERRVRAGKEVTRLMRDLGMSDGLGMDDLEDEDDLELVDGLPSIDQGITNMRASHA